MKGLKEYKSSFIQEIAFFWTQWSGKHKGGENKQFKNYFGVPKI